MAVRLRQKMSKVSGDKIYLEVLQLNSETGVGERVQVDQTAQLPDPKTMDLALMIKAGVPLNEVDCKLLNPVGTVGLVDVETKTEEK